MQQLLQKERGTVCPRHTPVPAPLGTSKGQGLMDSWREVLVIGQVFWV